MGATPISSSDAKGTQSRSDAYRREQFSRGGDDGQSEVDEEGKQDEREGEADDRKVCEESCTDCESASEEGESCGPRQSEAIGARAEENNCCDPATTEAVISETINPEATTICKTANSEWN
jgi:hypothetical protein